MIRKARLTLLTLLAALLTSVAFAVPKAPGGIGPLPTNILFSAGGISGRAIYLEDWDSTTDHKINDFIKHENKVWVAISEPAAGNEPGSHAAWLDITALTTTEDIQDAAGAMVSGNTETGITVTYDDTTGKINFSVTSGQGAPEDFVASGVVSGTNLILTRQQGGTVTIQNLPDGLSESEVTTLIRAIIIFHNGNGPPATNPPAGGYLALDKEGHLYGAISEQVTHTVAPSITTHNVPTNTTGAQLGSWWQGYDAAATGTEGHFTYNHYSSNFQQRVGSSTQHGRSWHTVLSYIASDGEPPADRINYASSAIYLGHYGSNAAAADAFSRNGTAVSRYSSGAPSNVGQRAYFIDSGARQLKRVESFAAGTSTVTNVLTWRDAPLTHVDLRSYVKEFAREGERGVRVGDMDPQSTPDGRVPKVSSGAVAWAEDAQRAFSTAAPAATAGTAAAGSGTEVPHANHVHDIGDSTIVEADLSAIVRQRLQQPGGIAGQVWTKDSGTNYDGSWQTPTSGTSTFIGDTDTPSSYTDAALDVVRVNADGTAVEFVDETPPAHAFPNVGRLPTFSDTSPNIVYLTDSYGLGGRVDATLTRGTDSSGTLTGYSDGEDLSETFGSINRESPMASLTGAVTGGTYHIQIVTSLNEAWIEEFSHIVIGTTEYTLLPTFLDSGVWHRRIQGFPENLTAASFAVNFRRSDGTYYFTNNADGTFLSGLWEKFDGQYSRLTSKGLVHIDGVGEPTELPTAAAQSYVDDLGRTWISGDMIIHPLSPPMITQANELVNPFFLPGRTVFELEEPGVPTGSFTYWLNVFWHRLEDGNTIHGTWNSIWSYLVREVPGWENIGRLSASLTTASNQIFLTSTSSELVEVGDFLRINTVEPYEIVEVTAVTDQATFTVDRGENGTTARTWTLETRIQLATGNPTGDTADTRRYLNDGVFLGHFASEGLAAEERSLYEDATKDYFFASPPQDSVPREIISYSGPTTIAEDHYFWNGPLITAEDALGIIEDVIIPNPPFADPTEDLFKLYIDGVTYDVESVVHPNRVTGDLRVAVASDWDFACRCARNLAWDGHQLLKADRYLDADHSADAVFTEVSPLTSFQLSGRTYRWRGENPYSAPNLSDLQDGDFTWWENGIRFLEWVEAHNLWENRNGSPTTYPLLAAINYVGYGANQAQALQQVTADGQRVVFERRPERARGTVRVQGAEGTTLSLGITMTTAAPSSVQFVLIQAGTIPAAGFIDLRVRARVGGTNGNLADQTPLTLDTAIPAVTSIVAQGAFTRGDDIRDDHKLWTVSEFRPAGSDEYRYRWIPAIVPAAVSNYLVFPDENGNMPPAQAHHYDATRGRSLVLGWDGNELLEVSRRLTGGHGGSATFTQVPDKTDIPGTTPTLRWRYTHWQDALVSDPEFRDVYYRRDNNTFRFRSGDQWLHFTAHEVFEDDSPYVYGGPYDSEADALPHVSALNQWIMYLRASDNAPIMYQVTAFTAPDPGHYVYFWRPLNDDILPPILGPFSSGESTSSDHFYAVKEGDSTAEVGYAIPAGGDSHRLDVVRWEESGTPYWGFQTSPTARGTLHDGSDLDLINILWIEGDTPADRFLGVEMEATSPLNVADNTLRVRLQPVRDVYQAGPNPAAWVYFPMSHSLGGTEVHSPSTPNNPFTEGAAQYWIGFDLLQSGVWVPQVHAPLWGYERILDGDDLSMEEPTRTNSRMASAGTSDKVSRDDHSHPGPPIDSVRIDLSQAGHWYGTGIHMDNQTTFHIHAEGSYYVYETSYNEIAGRTTNPDSVGGTPSSSDRWQIPNSTYEVNNDHAPFYVGRTGGSDPQLLIARLDSASTPTHIVVTAFRPSGSSDSSGYRHFVGDDAYLWATEGHDDVLVPVAKMGTGDASASVYLRGDGTWAAAVGGGGLDQAAVDARVVAGTQPQARAANNDQWPVAKLGTGTASASTFLRGDGTWQTVPAGGLDQAAVDARVVAGTQAPARAGNTDRWAPGKLGSGTPSTSTFLRGDGSWQTVPTGGLSTVARDSTLTGDGTTGAPLGVADGAIGSTQIANQGVHQADMASNSVGSPQVIDRSLLPSKINPAGSTDGHVLTSTGPSSDPAWEAPASGGAGGVPFVANSSITYSDSGGRRRVNLVDPNLNNDVGTMVMFQYADSDFSPGSQEVELGINGSGHVRWKVLDENLSQRNVTLGDIPRYTIYFLYRAGAFWQVVGQTQNEFVTDGRIDARVVAGTLAQARSGNTAQWPVAKLGTGSSGSGTYLRGDGAWADRNAAIEAQVAPWAHATGATGTAPVARLGTGTASTSTFLRGDGSWQTPPSGGGGGEDNVQADWTESDTASDAYIRNKPTLAPAGAEANVQADWSEANSASDAYIRNKPTTISAAQTTKLAGIEAAADVTDAENVYPLVSATVVAGSNVTINADATARRLTISSAGPDGGEENVQADWNESDSASDAFIQNKPNPLTAAAFTNSTARITFSHADGTTSGVPLGHLREFKGNNPDTQITFGYGDYALVGGSFYFCTAQSVTLTDPESSIPTHADFQRLPDHVWRGQHVSGNTYNPGDLTYTVRDSENVVWLAVEQTTSTPSIAASRQWINLTDTEHFRGEAFDGMGGDTPVFFEHGDLFVYDDRVWLVAEAVSITTNQIDSESGDRYDNLIELLNPDSLDDILNARISTANGELEESWALAAANTVPAGMTYCGAELLVANAVVADYAIYRYELDGTFIGKWLLNNDNQAPRGVACTGTEVLVVNDEQADHSMFRYELDGSYIGKWNLNVNNGSPLGVTWDGTEVNVLNSINDLVFRYSSTGTYNGTWSMGGVVDNAVGIAWTGYGYLVTDHNAARVLRYSAARSYLGNWAQGAGNDDSQGIAFANGSPYVLDEDDRVYRYVFATPAPATWARATGATGTAPVARLGTGTPSASNFLRGDGAWETPPTGLTSVLTGAGLEGDGTTGTPVQVADSGITPAMLDSDDATERAAFRQRIGVGRVLLPHVNSSQDLSNALLTGAGISSPTGITTDGTTIWVVDITDDAAYAFTIGTPPTRDASRDLSNALLTGAGISSPTGITTDGTTIWVVDITDRRPYAFTVGTPPTRDTSRDFNPILNSMQGIATDGTTIWLATTNEVRAYTIGTPPTRDTSRDLSNALLTGAGISSPTGITTDGTTIWVVDNTDDAAYAYTIGTPPTRDAYRDLSNALLTGAGISSPTGITIDGTTIWVVDNTDDAAYAFDIYRDVEDTVEDMMQTSHLGDVRAWASFPAMDVGANTWFAGEPSESYSQGITIGSFTISGEDYATFTVPAAGLYAVELHIPYGAAINSANHGFTVAKHTACPANATAAAANGVATRTFTDSGRWLGQAALNDCFWIRAPSSGGTDWPAGAVLSILKVD